MSNIEAPKETVLREETFAVKGTTKLDIWDEGYNQSGTNLEFHGNISAAPLGRLRISEVHLAYKDGFEFNEIRAEVFQAKDEPVLTLYSNGRHYKDGVKKYYDLNAETAQFSIETKYGYDNFRTGGDGVYGQLWHMKQYLGMIAKFYFDEDLFTFEEIKDRFLELFPRKRNRSKAA